MAMTQDAGDQLNASGADQDTAQEGMKSDSDSFFIPADSLEGKKYKKGDKITLEVMGEDDDGDLEVCFPDSGSTDWRSDLKSTMSAEGGDQNG